MVWWNNFAYLIFVVRLENFTSTACLPTYIGWGDISQDIVFFLFLGKSKLLNIDTKQTVGEFKKKHLSELKGLHPRQFRIFHRDVGAPYGDEEMIYSTRPLYRAKVKTGDEIHVYAK